MSFHLWRQLEKGLGEIAEKELCSLITICVDPVIDCLTLLFTPENNKVLIYVHM